MTNDRFGSISGLLTSKPAPRQATVHPITADTGEQPTEPPATRGQQRRRTAPAAKPKSEESTGGTRRIAFRLEPDLHARLVSHAKRSDTTHGNIVLDAIEAAHGADRLTDLIAAARNGTRPVSGGLFVRSAPRGAAKPSIPVEVQLNAQAVDQIDQLVAQYGADNRTQLIVAALQDHLDADR